MAGATLASVSGKHASVGRTRKINLSERWVALVGLPDGAAARKSRWRIVTATFSASDAVRDLSPLLT